MIESMLWFETKERHCRVAKKQRQDFMDLQRAPESGDLARTGSSRQLTQLALKCAHLKNLKWAQFCSVEILGEQIVSDLLYLKTPKPVLSIRLTHSQ